jgi:hypothetical protein
MVIADSGAFHLLALRRVDTGHFRALGDGGSDFSAVIQRRAVVASL